MGNKKMATAIKRIVPATMPLRAATVEQTEMDYDKVTEHPEAPEPENETKSDKFRRVVNQRIATAVERLRLIRKMFEGANASNYEFTQEQRVKMIDMLYGEISAIDELMCKRLDKTADAVPTDFL